MSVLVCGFKFAAHDPNPRTGSISDDGSLRVGPHDSNAMPELEMICIKEEGRDDDIGGSEISDWQRCP